MTFSQRAIEAATNWCDVLLTGPDCPSGPMDNRDVERLLLGIIKRMRDRAMPAPSEGEERK